MSKEFIYNRGVVRTHWKSVMNSKLNPLRQELGLEERKEPLKKGQYDKEALDAIAETDFFLLYFVTEYSPNEASLYLMV